MRAVPLICGAIVFAAALAGAALAAWGSDRQTALLTALANGNAALAHQRGLLAQQIAVERQYAVLRSMQPANRRSDIIETLSRMSLVAIRRVEIGAGGRTCALSLAGSYPDLMTAAVALPAKIQGLTIKHIVVSAAAADASLPANAALARIEGALDS